MNGTAQACVRLGRSVMFSVLVLFQPGCDRDTRKSEPIVLRIDDRTVTRREFDRRMLPKLVARGNPPPGSEAYADEVQKLLKEEVDEQLILGEARRKGYTLDPGEADREVERLLAAYDPEELEQELTRRYQTIDQWREDMARRLLLRKVIATLAGEVPAVQESEIRQRFDTFRGRYEQAEQLSVSQILVRTETEAADVLQLLRKKNVPFGDLARTRSIAPEASRDGLMGSFAPGELPPEIEEPVRRLTTGEISDAIRTSYGYHIFRLNGVTPAGPVPYEQVKDRIAAELRNERQDAALNEWLEHRRRETRIEIADDVFPDVSKERN